MNIGSNIKISLSRDIRVALNIGSGTKSSYFTRMNIGSNIKISLSRDIGVALI